MRILFISLVSILLVFPPVKGKNMPYSHKYAIPLIGTLLSPSVDAGSDATICSGSNLDLSTLTIVPAASDFNTLQWSTSGDGSFDDMNALIPIYIPGVDDIADGTVTLTLEATGSGTASDNMILTIINAAEITVPSSAVDICESGGPVDLTSLVSGIPSGGTFGFTGTNVVNGLFDPTGLSGLQSISVDYTVGVCNAFQKTLDIDVLVSPDISVPTAAVVSCENEGLLDLTTIVSATPTGGTFSFAGAGVTGNTFDPTGLPGSNIVSVDYSLNSCSDSDSFEIFVLESTDDACASDTGTCEELAITTSLTDATCNDTDGAVTFNLNPPIPAINNTGVIFNIDGPTTLTQTENPIFDDIPGGDYTYSIQYGDPSCIKTGTFSITKSGAFGTPVASNIQNALCFGEPSGSAIVSIPEETGNVFEWSLGGNTWIPFAAGTEIGGIPAGESPSFETTINIRRDNTSCTEQLTLIIENAYEEITTNITVLSNSSCDNNDGSVMLGNTSGGDTSSPYSYELDGAPYILPEGGIIGSLSGGDHLLGIIDAQNCQKDFSFTIEAPGIFEYNLSSTEPTCFENGIDGKIQVVVDAAFLPNSYEVAITTSNAEELIFEPIPESGFFEYSGLSKGRYFITVRSADDGCEKSSFIDLEGGPTAINFTTATVCSESNAVILLLNDLTGDPNAVITIEVYSEGTASPINTLSALFPPDGEINIENQAFLQEPGNYSLRLFQAQSSCQPELIASELIGFIVNEGISAETENIRGADTDELAGEIKVSNFSGGEGNFEVQATLDSASVAGQSYASGWIMVDGTGNGQAELVLDNLPAGRYLIEIRDNSGCIATLVERVALDPLLSTVALQQNKGITISPNPAQSFIDVYLPNSLIHEAAYRLIGSNGIPLFRSNKLLLHNGVAKIDISTLPSGLYFIELYTGSKKYVNEILIIH